MRLLLTAASALASLHAEVADSAANGFTVKQTWTIQAAPDAVYQGFVHKIGDWWNSAHTFSGDAHNLTIDPKATGCFCEKIPKAQGTVRHLEVVFLLPGKLIRFTGGMGPLQSMAVNGAMTVQFSPASDGAATKLDLTYAVGGYMNQGLNTMAPNVDMMLMEQFGRLKSYLETG